MNLIEFNKLCRDAGAQLGREDIELLSVGDTVDVDGVVFEAAFVEGQVSFQMLAHLGEIAAEDMVGVCESLLTLQMASRHGTRARFGWQPAREMAVLTVIVPLGGKTDGAALSSLLKSMAAQVNQWRQTLLAGKLVARHSSLGLAGAGFGAGSLASTV